MIDLDALEAAARAATPGPWLTAEDWPGNGRRYIVESKQRSVASTRTWDNDNTDADAAYIAAANPAIVLTIIARLRAAEGALMAIHEFANDDGNWEHEEIIADDGMFIGCDGRYTVEAMASDALKGMSDAVPNV